MDMSNYLMATFINNLIKSLTLIIKIYSESSEHCSKGDCPYLKL